jgi:NitT/TauT family transport system substrate-binding protein
VENPTVIDRRRALALIGAAALAPAAALAADAPATIRIAYMTTDAFAQGLYADAGGFFKAAGLNVELVMLGNSGSIAAAVAGGSVDIGLGNPISLANAVESGLPFYAIAPSAMFVDSKPQSFMVVAKSSPYQSAKDLAGKTIGLVEVRGVTQAATAAWLRKAGVDPANAKYVEMPFPAMGAALATGRIDAAFIADTALMAFRADTRSLGCPYAALAPQWYLNLWYSGKDWLAKNPALARRFIAAVEKSAGWANAHQAETGAMLQKYVPLPNDVLAQMTRTDFAGKLDVSRIQPVLDAAVREGAIKRPIDAHDFLASP